MTKWKYVIEWLLPPLILHHGCTAYDINSEVCLETPFYFALGKTQCWFTLADAKDWFESETGGCSKKCQVKINDLESKAWRYYDGSPYTPHYQLKSLTLSFNGLSENLTTINTSCSYSIRKRSLKVICKSDFENAVDLSKDLCTSTKICEDVTKTCSLKGQIGVCECSPGYIGFRNECLQGNLKLNDRCKRNEQCSMVFGSICQNDTYVCGRGYKPFNDSECLSHSSGNSEARALDQKEDTIVSVTVGSVIGGLILGIVLTVLGLIIYQNIRNGKPKAEKKKWPKAAVFNNTTFETERDADQNIPTVQRTNERKVVNVPPFAHSIDLPVKKNIQDAKQRSMANSDVNNGVYNHLHEKEEDLDIDENYDHAHGNNNRAMEESDYSNLNTGRR